MKTDSIAPSPPREIQSPAPAVTPTPEGAVTETAAPETGSTSPAKKSEAKAAKKIPVKAKHEVPRFLQYPYVARPAAETAKGAPAETAPAGAADSIAADSIAADTASAVVEGEEMQGLVIVNPASQYKAPESGGDSVTGTGMSWIYLALALLFCITAIRFKGSSKYLKALFSDLTDTRVRHNAFDDTVRETSLLVLLNIFWAACAGILLWNLVRLTAPDIAAYSFSIPDRPVAGIFLCTAVAAGYVLAMLLTYWIVGSVFSDRSRTRLWVKGAAASTALQTILLFPLALLALSYPASRTDVLIIAATVFAVGKIIFLYKGFRIFFTQISSWLLFLYYLCSLEIVPLILTYLATITACNAWL